MTGRRFSEIINEIDGRYIEEAVFYQQEKKQRRHFRHLSAAWAAVLLILSLAAAAAVAAGIFGTKLLDSYTSRREPGTDFVESGYDLAVEIQRIPHEELSEQVRNAGQLIVQQFENYTPTNSWYAGLRQTSFSSREQACDYIGFPFLNELDWDLKEQNSVLNIHGNKEGDILYLNLETDYAVDKIRLQCFSIIYTDNYQDEIVIGSRTAEAVKFSESFYETVSGKKCHIISSTEMDSGYLGMEGYIVDDGILYSVNISYLKEDAGKAQELLRQWADLF